MSDAKKPSLILPSWGSQLTAEDYAGFEKCWISREIVEAAMLRRVSDLEGREIVGQKGKRDCAGILFTYYWPGDPSGFNHRIRRDNPEWTQDKNGNPKPAGKYLGPPKGGNRLYIPPGVTPEQLADTTIPIALVEGEKKALALWRLANYETDRPRFIPIAIAGVWNWRGKVARTGGPNGEWLDIKGPIADLGRIVWDGRKVFVVFDSNVHTNDTVKWARKGISRELATRNATVDFVNIPEDRRVNGIDDLLASWGPAKVLELFERTVSGARLEVRLPPQFQSKPEGMFRTSGREQLLQVQLTNFQAVIAANIRLDDGVETRREFEIASELMGRKSSFTIPAAEFGKMDWAIERMGSSAITFPNQRDYARTAIQSFSLSAEERAIYVHTGWRNVEGQWLYLHAGGAIGGSGAVPGVNVRLSGTLSRYELRLPSGTEALASAIRADLMLTELGPPEVAFPLLAATYRAVLGDADFAVHLAGETGAFKSEVAALHQQHFGSGMNRVNLPGAWSSTGNALESMAFCAKDALFVIDDFAPQGSSADVARYHAAADRVFRAAGNHAGRARLDSAAKLRESKPPRALILSTGEDIPRGQSVRARLLIVELAKWRIDPDFLSACQSDARRGVYAESMLFCYGEAREAFRRKVSEYRAKALLNSAHARTPDILANLQAAFDMFLEFAVESGAIDPEYKTHLLDRCWNALCEVAGAQAKHQRDTEPTARFLALLSSVLTSGRAHLAARDGGVPDRSPVSCGWRRDSSGNYSPLGDCIGWVEEDDLFLESTAAFRVVQTAGRDLGEILSVSESTLRKRLNEKRLLASVDTTRETLTVRRIVCGSSKTVLHFRRATILPEVSDPDDDADEGGQMSGNLSGSMSGNRAHPT